MTVRELREALANLSDHLLVVMSKDGEGNSFSPLAFVDGEDVSYEPRNGWSGEVKMTKLTPDDIFNGYGPDDLADPDNSSDCVVLWPTN